MYQKVYRSIFVLMLVIGMVAVQAPMLVLATGPWYVATTGDDANDCLSPSTSCATINGAIGKASAGDTINVAVGTYTDSGTEVILIDKDITLSGGWNTDFTLKVGTSYIDGESTRRGLQVNGGVSAIIEALNIRNGLASNAGGILTFGNLTINLGVIENNTANGLFGIGGGIVNDGDGILTLNHTSIINNKAIGMNSLGGGILSNGDLILNNVNVSGNQTPLGDGAGIYGVGGKALLVNSMVNGNTAPDGAGGGLFLQIPVVIIGSTISNNEVLGPGAGILFDGIDATIINSTISGNISKSDINFGGGIYNSGNMKISNSTITGNSSQNYGGGIRNGAIITIQNSIIALNSAPNAGPDCASGSNASVISLGYNLIGDTSDCGFTLSNGDMSGLSPLLGPLQDNGGPTFTHAVLLGSPAIDMGNPAGCTDQDGNLLTTDQRGIARPQGAACDIGAFELEAANPTLEVSIDIKPGSNTNPINTKSMGKTPVAILSSADFDALAMVDTSSLTFGKTGDESSLAFCDDEPEDVNGDGTIDLVCYFHTKKTGFQSGDSEGILKGKTIDEISLEGRDNVRVRK